LKWIEQNTHHFFSTPMLAVIRYWSSEVSITPGKRQFGRCAALAADSVHSIRSE